MKNHKDDPTLYLGASTQHLGPGSQSGLESPEASCHEEREAATNDPFPPLLPRTVGTRPWREGPGFQEGPISSLDLSNGPRSGHGVRSGVTSRVVEGGSLALGPRVPSGWNGSSRQKGIGLSQSRFDTNYGTYQGRPSSHYSGDYHVLWVCLRAIGECPRRSGHQRRSDDPTLKSKFESPFHHGRDREGCLET